MCAQRKSRRPHTPWQPCLQTSPMTNRTATWRLKPVPRMPPRRTKAEAAAAAAVAVGATRAKFVKCAKRAQKDAPMTEAMIEALAELKAAPKAATTPEATLAPAPIAPPAKPW